MYLVSDLLAYIDHLQTDVYVLSFPKCGRTWYRFMLGNSFVNIFSLKEMPLNEILMVKNLHAYNKNIPKIKFSHDDLPQWKYYKNIEVNKGRYKNKNVIFLIRDPRDLVVSNYYQKKYRSFKVKKGVDKKVFEGNISEFIRHESGGLPNIIEYYNVWANQRNIPNGFYLLKYEDLQYNSFQVMTDTLSFININNYQKDDLLKAIEDSTFEKMREIETNRLIDNSRLQAGSANNTQSFKTRKGKVGSYKEDLEESDIIWIEDYIKNNLDDFYSFYKK